MKVEKHNDYAINIKAGRVTEVWEISEWGRGLMQWNGIFKKNERKPTILFPNETTVLETKYEKMLRTW